MIKNISGKFWGRASIGLLLILAVLSIVMYQIQLQKKDSIEQEIASIKEKTTVLQNNPLPDVQQLSSEYASLQKDIESAKSSLDKAIIDNSIVTLVGIARDTSIELLYTKPSDINTIYFDEIPYNMMTLDLRVEGSGPNLMSFIKEVSRELGAVSKLTVGIAKDITGNTSASVADLEVHIYSYSE